ncbi:hypothetical protein Tsubulata_030647 [Turnera subulata]|uniref:Uncharacterized protein n=1 Tax=Turnera subulata TaxID=218843 RepID=A0A9Q0FEU8_9ROSI|nr:hypothetical protein Tsubulata_030647 [Turnera subulata]
MLISIKASTSEPHPKSSHLNLYNNNNHSTPPPQWLSTHDGHLSSVAADPGLRTHKPLRSEEKKRAAEKTDKDKTIPNWNTITRTTPSSIIRTTHSSTRAGARAAAAAATEWDLWCLLVVTNGFAGANERLSGGGGFSGGLCLLQEILIEALAKLCTWRRRDATSRRRRRDSVCVGLKEKEMRP